MSYFNSINSSLSSTDPFFDETPDKDLRRKMRHQLTECKPTQIYNRLHKDCDHSYYVTSSKSLRFACQPAWPLESSIANWVRGGGPPSKLKGPRPVTECLTALNSLPKEKTALVVGSGGNTELWKNQGWITMDPSLSNCNGAKPDHLCSLHDLTSSLGQLCGHLDYVFFEFLPGEVQNQDSFQDVWEALAPGGRLIIETGGAVNCKTHRSSLLKLLSDLHAAGFETSHWLGLTGFKSEVMDKSRAQVLMADAIIVAQKPLESGNSNYFDEEHAAEALLDLFDL